MAPTSSAERLHPAARRRLLELARLAVAHAAETGALHRPDVEREEPLLREPGATFVTLRIRGAAAPTNLRGCIGSLLPSRPLAVDVAVNGAAAALHDPRFSPVRAEEVATLEVSVSVLSAFARVRAGSERELLGALRPGIDGLLIREGGRRAVFLPQVWEQLPAPSDFLDALRHKAGLPSGWFSESFVAERFTVEKIDDPSASS